MAVEENRSWLPRGGVEKADEEPRVFDHPTGRWLREGYCSQCGECCMGADPSDYDDRLTESDRAARQFECVCPLLRFDGEKYSCAGHGTHQYYIEASMNHPQCPGDLALTPSCTYRFTRLKD